MNWIRKAKRLAIYLRDGLSCCWCGLSVEDGAQLTLDHLIARSRGGSNEETNLVTACVGCNARRKHYSVAIFARVMSQRFDGQIPAYEFVQHVQHAARQPIDVAAAEALIRRRGGFSAVLRQHVA
jgi:hypothetical protein